MSLKVALLCFVFPAVVVPEFSFHAIRPGGPYAADRVTVIGLWFTVRRTPSRQRVGDLATAQRPKLTDRLTTQHKARAVPNLCIRLKNKGLSRIRPNPLPFFTNRSVSTRRQFAAMQHYVNGVSTWRRCDFCPSPMYDTGVRGVSGRCQPECRRRSSL